MCQAAREAREHAAVNTWASELRQQAACALPATVASTLREGRDIWHFHEQHTDSKIMEMDLNGIDVHKVMERMDRVAAISAEISEALGHSKWGYSPLTLQFENAGAPVSSR